MISVIIPSLMRIDRLHRTLSELSSCDVVGEIILIDNSENPVDINIDKVLHIKEFKNTFINPAWNKGASIAKFDKLCFMNDDIWFDWKYLKDIDQLITTDVGFLGMSYDNYYTPSESFKLIDPFPDGKTIRGFRPIGFACCFFVHKDNWDYIPDDLKLWCGDDWLFYRSKNPNYLIDGIKCEGFLSATLSDDDLKEVLNPIKENDMEVMISLINKGIIENYLIGTKWWK